MSDADDIVSINTHQRTVITKLRRTGAKEIDSGMHGTTAWATFEMPVALLEFPVTPQSEARKDIAELAANAAAGARLAASRPASNPPR